MSRRFAFILLLKSIFVRMQPAPLRYITCDIPRPLCYRILPRGQPCSFYLSVWRLTFLLVLTALSITRIHLSFRCPSRSAARHAQSTSSILSLRKGKTCACSRAKVRTSSVGGASICGSQARVRSADKVRIRVIYNLPLLAYFIFVIFPGTEDDTGPAEHRASQHSHVSQYLYF